LTPAKINAPSFVITFTVIFLSDLSHSEFPTKILCVFLVSVCATWIARLTSLDLVKITKC
jgi:hypothetical protein